jgi:hypothetical protein
MGAAIPIGPAMNNIFMVSAIRLRKISNLCHSERSEESLLVSFLILKSKRDSSLR